MKSVSRKCSPVNASRSLFLHGLDDENVNTSEFSQSSAEAAGSFDGLLLNT